MRSLVGGQPILEPVHAGFHTVPKSPDLLGECVEPSVDASFESFEPSADASFESLEPGVDASFESFEPGVDAVEPSVHPVEPSVDRVEPGVEGSVQHQEGERECAQDPDDRPGLRHNAIIAPRGDTGARRTGALEATSGADRMR